MIQKNQLGNIFDAYYQIPSNEKTTGFGLGLVKRIADLHKGIILVQQSKLGGAEFIFKLKKSNL
ncbi:MAG: signal transduction histidine kinase [Polaribacter sp.]|jgi:signal transduction histidine kinase